MTDLRQQIADQLVRARRRSEALTTDVLDGAELVLDAPPPPRPAVDPVTLPRDVLVPSGPFTMGTSVEPWALDNERPAHQVQVPAFRIDTFPVSNAEFAAFVDDGGYDDSWWWDGRGSSHRKQAGLGGAHLGPSPRGAHPAGASPLGVHQLIGDVWEWTGSGFDGYPGFGPYPYAEYSDVFFGGDYRMLRGGSWATDPAACRGTFRNWDLPIRRQIFTGPATRPTAR